MNYAPSQLPEIFTNTAWQSKTPISLSVLIPFYKDDPQELLYQLACGPHPNTEIILYDDGSENAQLSECMSEEVLHSPLPVQLISAAENHGRSAARNALIAAARGKWILFLDADMMPPDHSFLTHWLSCIQQHTPAIAFGGFSVKARHAVEQDFALHQAFSQSSDCLPADERMKNPAKHVCTSNLLVRRTILEDYPFDDGFAGWGWEDVEWAARAVRAHSILHIDNPAYHLGLESADTLVRRFRDSAPNYARFVARHPDLARTLPSWKAAHVLRAIPGFSILRPVLATMARDRAGLLPLGLRIMALKLWRSSWYAKALS